jgi:hypothetical protein
MGNLRFGRVVGLDREGDERRRQPFAERHLGHEGGS